MTNLELIDKAYQEGIQIQQEKTVKGTFVPSDAMYDDLVMMCRKPPRFNAGI